MLYQEIVMEHYRKPSNRGELQDPSFSISKENLSCGDKIKMEGVVKDGCLVEVGFVGQGCVISQASASMLTEEMKGKEIAEIEIYKEDQFLELIGIPLGPVRKKCALISLQALKEGVISSSTV